MSKKINHEWHERHEGDEDSFFVLITAPAWQVLDKQDLRFKKRGEEKNTIFSHEFTRMDTN